MKLGFIRSRTFRRSFLPRVLEFTWVQMLQHNVQLGASIRFSLLSSHWFLFGFYKNFSIINLSQTTTHYRYFLEVVRYVTSSSRHVLFVNERRYTKSIVTDVVRSVGEAYVVGRWVGGSLTNFKKLRVMYNRVLRFKSVYELSSFRANLKYSLQGLSLLRSLPSLIFLNSVRLSRWAMGEAYALLIPSAGITDTDALPHSVLYPIPGNDDAFSSVVFFNQLAAKAILIEKVSSLLKKYERFLVSFKRWLLARKRKRFNKKRIKSTGGVFNNKPFSNVFRRRVK